MTGADKVVCQAATLLLLFTLTSMPAKAQFAGIGGMMGGGGGDDMMTQMAPMLEMMKAKMGKRRFAMMMQTMGPMMSGMMEGGGGGHGRHDGRRRNRRLRRHDPRRHAAGYGGGDIMGMMGGMGGGDMMAMIPQMMRMANFGGGAPASSRDEPLTLRYDNAGRPAGTATAASVPSASGPRSSRTAGRAPPSSGGQREEVCAVASCVDSHQPPAAMKISRAVCASTGPSTLAAPCEEKYIDERQPDEGVHRRRRRQILAAGRAHARDRR